MIPQVQHDPRIKQQIKDALHQHLYGPVEQAFKRREEVLVLRNSVLIKATHKSFLYKGRFYAIDGPPYPRKANRLAQVLYPEMNEHLEEVHHLNTREMPYVVGFINQVLNSSNHLEDYLALLPEALHPIIQKFIDACPCRNNALSAEALTDMRIQHMHSISMIKARMTTNLLY